MTRAEKSLMAERARLDNKLTILLWRVEDVKAAIARIDNALSALKAGEPKR